MPPQPLLWVSYCLLGVSCHTLCQAHSPPLPQTHFSPRTTFPSHPAPHLPSLANTVLHPPQFLGFGTCRCEACPPVLRLGGCSTSQLDFLVEEFHTTFPFGTALPCRSYRPNLGTFRESGIFFILHSSSLLHPTGLEMPALHFVTFPSPHLLLNLLPAPFYTFLEAARVPHVPGGPVLALARSVAWLVKIWVFVCSSGTQFSPVPAFRVPHLCLLPELHK